ncbi:hypothetical protein MXB_4698, partial [Myxobolus squamalis]
MVPSMEIPDESLMKLFIQIRDFPDNYCMLCYNKSNDTIYTGCCQKPSCRSCMEIYLQHSAFCLNCYNPFSCFFYNVQVNFDDFKNLEINSLVYSDKIQNDSHLNKIDINKISAIFDEKDFDEIFAPKNVINNSMNLQHKNFETNLIDDNSNQT